MLLQLDDRPLKEVLRCLTVPTGLACFVDDGRLPPAGLLMAVCARARDLQPLLAVAGGQIETADRGITIFTNVFPADIYAILVRSSKWLRTRITPMLEDLGALQPHLPALDHVQYDFRRDGTLIWLRFRDLLIIQWRKLGTAEYF